MFMILVRGFGLYSCTPRIGLSFDPLREVECPDW
jgi:hypothetical protein